MPASNSEARKRSEERQVPEVNEHADGSWCRSGCRADTGRKVSGVPAPAWVQELRAAIHVGRR